MRFMTGLNNIEMNRRVVITGMGVITPVGNDIQTYWDNLVNGVCGIDFIKSIPTDDLPVSDEQSDDAIPPAITEEILENNE